MRAPCPAQIMLLVLMIPFIFRKETLLRPFTIILRSLRPCGKFREILNLNGEVLLASWPTPKRPLSATAYWIIHSNLVITSSKGPNKLCHYKRVSLQARCRGTVKGTYWKTKCRPAGRLLHGYTVRQQYPTLYFPTNAHNVKKRRVIKNILK